MQIAVESEYNSKQGRSTEPKCNIEGVHSCRNFYHNTEATIAPALPGILFRLKAAACPKRHVAFNLTRRRGFFFPPMSETMSEFKQYRRKQIAELRPYTGGESIDGVTVSIADRAGGSPKAGDMIARNPKNHADQWLVSAQYFADNFEPV
jgi:hypothetical protein